MSWWHRLIRRRTMETQLEKELRFHLEQHAADLIEKGYQPAEARREARLAIGGPEQVKEECRDARGTRWLEDLWQDFRYALRSLRKNSGFVAVALVTLALGCGATTVMFTIINGVLYRPLPYSDPEQLLTLQEQTEKATQWGNLWAFSYPNFLDCQRASRSLLLGAWRNSGGTVSKPGEPEYVDGVQVSHDLLPLLGVAPLQGRMFRPEEDKPGATPVAMISYGLWQRRYSGSTAALGTALFFEGKPYTLIGISRQGFRLQGIEPDVITLLGQNTEAYMQNRQIHPGLRLWGRVVPGSTPAQAHTELTLISRRLAEQYPASNAERSFIFNPLRPEVGDVSSTLWLLFGAVSLVLLIACVNVASLLLARAVSRERELAMRTALGAGRGRLIRQCLTESSVLGLAGGALGILLAAAGVRPLVAFWPGSLPRAEEVHLDWRVLLVALTASLLSGLLFGMAPALRAPGLDPERSLRAGARTVAGASRRLHSSFVISEIALAVVLLISAGMLGRSLLHLSSLDPGVDIHNVVTARMALSPATLTNPDKTRAAWKDILDRALSVPGVQSIAMVDTVPMRDGNNQIGYSTTAAKLPPDKQPLALTSSVTPEYLDVMRLRLLEGRFIDEHDRKGSESVAVIDQVMAKEAFGSQRAVGKFLWLDLTGDPVRVIGVVAHVRYWGLASDDQSHVRAQLYYPFAQVPDALVRRWSELMSISVRTTLPPLNVVDPLRRAVRGAAGDQVFYEVNTLEQLARGSLSRQRFLMILFGVFAGLALLLACIGIYGVMAYLTNQRVPELGVRMALGARSSDVMWLVLRQSLSMILMGVAIGSISGLAATRLLQHAVDGMQPTEPITFSLLLGALLTAALIASFGPARRASRLDPVRALRQD